MTAGANLIVQISQETIIANDTVLIIDARVIYACFSFDLQMPRFTSNKAMFCPRAFYYYYNPT